MFYFICSFHKHLKGFVFIFIKNQCHTYVIGKDYVPAYGRVRAFVTSHIVSHDPSRSYPSKRRGVCYIKFLISLGGNRPRVGRSKIYFLFMLFYEQFRISYNTLWLVFALYAKIPNTYSIDDASQSPCKLDYIG